MSVTWCAGATVPLHALTVLRKHKVTRVLAGSTALIGARAGGTARVAVAVVVVVVVVVVLVDPGARRSATRHAIQSISSLVSFARSAMAVGVGVPR